MSLFNVPEREIFKRTVLLNRWIPHKPTPKQAEFLCCQCREALYGGAAGGGKSDALLMSSLQYADVQGYNAILFRKTFADLALPEALMDRAMQWLGGTDARWHAGSREWIFPSGARLVFGYLQDEADKFRYQSAEFQFIGFDELTQFTEGVYRYLFSRLRRLSVFNVPLRMRAASNPGNIGHDWVKQRFMVEGAKYGRQFIAAKLSDNPYLDRQAYVKSLMELDAITRKQYLEGDWTAKFGGNKFRREWFDIVEAPAPKDASRVRYWDMAATTDKRGGDPDYTVGAKLALHNGIYTVEDIQRFRERPAVVEARIKQTAAIDYDLHGYNCQVFMEEEPGSAGIGQIDHYARNILLGYAFRGHRVTGNKEVRANPVSSAAEQGNVKLMRGSWVGAFLDEVEAFPLGAHDDQVDAVSGAFETLPAGPITALLGEVQY